MHLYDYNINSSIADESVRPNKYIILFYSLSSICGQTQTEMMPYMSRLNSHRNKKTRIKPLSVSR